MGATSDQELLNRCRTGDTTAFAALYERHHRLAIRVAAGVSSRHEPEDMVAEAFTRIWAAIREGSGPTHAFKPYLRTAIRNVAATWAARHREDPLEPEQLERTSQHRSPGAADVATSLGDQQLITQAFSSLPDRWRTVLWMTEVDGKRATEVAAELGITPNAAAALTMRARDALSQAWLQQQVELPADGVECEWVRERIGAHVRRALSELQEKRVRNHLEACGGCARTKRRLAHLGSSLRLAAILAGGSAAALAGWLATPPARAATGVTVARRALPPSTSIRTPLWIGAAAAAVVGVMAFAVTTTPPSPQSTGAVIRGAVAPTVLPPAEPAGSTAPTEPTGELGLADPDEPEVAEPAARSSAPPAAAPTRRATAGQAPKASGKDDRPDPEPIPEPDPGEEAQPPPTPAPPTPAPPTPAPPMPESGEEEAPPVPDEVESPTPAPPMPAPPVPGPSEEEAPPTPDEEIEPSTPAAPTPEPPMPDPSEPTPTPPPCGGTEPAPLPGPAVDPVPADPNLGSGTPGNSI